MNRFCVVTGFDFKEATLGKNEKNQRAKNEYGGEHQIVIANEFDSSGFVIHLSNSWHITTKLTGANGAQRNLHPVQRLVRARHLVRYDYVLGLA